MHLRRWTRSGKGWMSLNSEPHWRREMKRCYLSHTLLLPHRRCEEVVRLLLRRRDYGLTDLSTRCLIARRYQFGLTRMTSPERSVCCLGQDKQATSRGFLEGHAERRMEADVGKTWRPEMPINSSAEDGQDGDRQGVPGGHQV